MRRFLMFPAVCVAWLVLIQTALAHGIIPRDVPVDRLVANLTQYIKENPNDAEGYYRLGRVHTLALETKTEFVIAYEQQVVRPAEGSWAHRTPSATGKPTPSTPVEVRNHLSEAVRLLNKAIAMQPTEARYRLTLASALEAGMSLSEQVDVWPLAPVAEVLNPPPANAEARYYIERIRRSFENPSPGSADELLQYVRDPRDSVIRDIVMTVAYETRNRPNLRDLIRQLRAADWTRQIEDQLFIAMTYALPADGKALTKPIWGGMDDWVSYEAGRAFIRIVEARRSRPSDNIRLRVARETIRSFDNLPAPQGITPIVLDFGRQTLAQIGSRKLSTFDLDGSNRPQHWSWVTPSTGILVWDPERSGRITSGRQLFGSVTWWVFFDNGYQALDTLDDDRDGALRGAELGGLAVWFDRNENGVSDTDEVVPVEDLEIVEIATRPTGTEAESLVNPKGFMQRDGTARATYDWISTSVIMDTTSRHELTEGNRLRASREH